MDAEKSLRESLEDIFSLTENLTHNGSPWGAIADIRKVIRSALAAHPPREDVYNGRNDSLSPVPRGHCDKCHRCGGCAHPPYDDPVRMKCNRIFAPRSHCSGCGAPYRTEEPDHV